LLSSNVPPHRSGGEIVQTSGVIGYAIADLSPSVLVVKRFGKMEKGAEENEPLYKRATPPLKGSHVIDLEIGGSMYQ
jgi:hypothetical protein